jgi:hypothetical protein
MSSTHCTARPNGVLAAKLEQKLEQKPEQKPIIPPPNERPPPTPEERAALEAQAAREKVHCFRQRTAMKRQWKGNLILPTKEQQDEYDAIANIIRDSE